MSYSTLIHTIRLSKKNLATGKSIRYRILRLATILVPGTNSLHISFAEVMRENMKGSACCG